MHLSASGIRKSAHVPAVAAAICLLFAPCGSLHVHAAQSGAPPAAPQLPPNTVDHLRGVVYNSVDGKPVPRVLVTSMGDQGLAVLTDYEGRFSFDLRRPLPQPNQAPDPFTGASSAAQTTTIPFNLRKPGYTSTTETAVVARYTPSGPEPEIRLPITPAGLISGHITASSGSLPSFLNVLLRRKQINEGIGFYATVASAQVDASGNYRFPELTPGDYKITTQASTDSSVPRAPRAQQPDSLPGLLPATYPDVTSLDSASPIHIGPGATVIADLNLRTAPFYRVTIPIASSDAVAGVMASLSPEAPGLLLSYNPRLGAVAGYLPDGTYTVHLRSGGRATQAQTIAAQVRTAQGLLNLRQQNAALTASLPVHVAGAPLKIDPVTLHPGFDIAVNVRLDFTPDDSAQAPVPHYLALANGQQMPNPQSAPVMVNLLPLEAGNSFMNAASSVPEPDGELQIPNVSEGVYRVRVFPTHSGYIAALTCGATNLLRDPLVVGPSGINAPIEVTLRNDGASLKLTLDDQTLPAETSSATITEPALAAVSIVPLDAPQTQALSHIQMLHPAASASYLSNALGQFTNLAPGRYLILAVRTNRNPLISLEYNDPGVREALIARGTVVTLSPNQKADVRVPVLPPEPEN